MYEIASLKTKKLSELQEMAKTIGVKKITGLKKMDLIYQIIDHVAANPKVASSPYEIMPSEPTKKESLPIIKPIQPVKKNNQPLTKEQKNSGKFDNRPHNNNNNGKNK